jgi:hypothetical protein
VLVIYYKRDTPKLKTKKDTYMTIDNNQNIIDPGTVTDAAIDAETNRIIMASCAKHNIQPSQLPEGAIDDARRAAREMVESESAKESNEYYHLYMQEKAAHAATSATLGAVKQNQGVTTANQNYRHPVTAERARELMGRAQWFMCTEAQKIQAMDVDPKSVDKAQVRALFGKNHDVTAAVDFSKANPRRYAALREVAKALNIYGA